jgi:hypothetical protein
MASQFHRWSKKTNRQYKRVAAKRGWIPCGWSWMRSTLNSFVLQSGDDKTEEIIYFCFWFCVVVALLSKQSDLKWTRGAGRFSPCHFITSQGPSRFISELNVNSTHFSFPPPRADSKDSMQRVWLEPFDNYFIYIGPHHPLIKPHKPSHCALLDREDISLPLKFVLHALQ